MAIEHSAQSGISDFPAKETPTNQEPQQPTNETRNEVFHKTKTIQFGGRERRILMQESNGPCPLLTLCNVLILRDEISLHDSEVSQKFLLSLVAHLLLEYNNKLDSDSQNKLFSEAMEHLSSLACGIDVDLKFRSIFDFEYTPTIAAFQLLQVPLCHGWIVEFGDPDTAAALGDKSYNALTTELGTETVEAHLIEKFFQTNPTQITSQGIYCLHQGLKEGQPCVLFRNNHFSTILKREEGLFTLVNDYGFMMEHDFVWARLNQVEGDIDFTNANFEPRPLKLALIPIDQRPLKKRRRLTEPEPEAEAEPKPEAEHFPCQYSLQHYRHTCALLGCFLPRAASGYCCDAHKDFAVRFSQQTTTSYHCFGGLNDLEYMEQCCYAAISNKADGLAVGIPLLQRDEIFSTPPWDHPDLFSTQITPVSCIFFHKPPTILTSMELSPSCEMSLPDRKLKWSKNPKFKIHLDGSDHKKVWITSLTLTNLKYLKNAGMSWQLYQLELDKEETLEERETLEGTSLYCLHMRGSKDPLLKRLRRNFGGKGSERTEPS